MSELSVKKSRRCTDEAMLAFREEILETATWPRAEQGLFRRRDAGSWPPSCRVRQEGQFTATFPASANFSWRRPIG